MIYAKSLTIHSCTNGNLYVLYLTVRFPLKPGTTYNIISRSIIIYSKTLLILFLKFLFSSENKDHSMQAFIKRVL